MERDLSVKQISVTNDRALPLKTPRGREPEKRSLGAKLTVLGNLGVKVECNVALKVWTGAVGSVGSVAEPFQTRAAGNEAYSGRRAG